MKRMGSFRVSNLKVPRVLLVLLIAFCASTVIAQTSAQTEESGPRLYRRTGEQF
jgi:hypothetical protein